MKPLRGFHLSDSSDSSDSSDLSDLSDKAPAPKAPPQGDEQEIAHFPNKWKYFGIFVASEVTYQNCSPLWK